MNFKPQNWIKYGNCPYCDSGNVYDEEENRIEFNVAEVIKRLYCENCYSQIDIGYVFNFLRTSDGDEYTVGEMLLDTNNKMSVLRKTLHNLKMDIANALVGNSNLTMSQFSSLVSEARKVNSELQ
jgi:hypothetical protein